MSKINQYKYLIDLLKKYPDFKKDCDLARGFLEFSDMMKDVDPDEVKDEESHGTKSNLP